MQQPQVFEASKLDMGPAPIRPEWVIDGNPVAENHVVFSSDDRAIVTILWQCSAGSFQWVYDEEETIYLLDGGMTLTFPNGEVRQVGKGDVVYFAAGTTARWDIQSHVKKIAVFRRPTPRLVAPFLALAHKAANVMARLRSRGGGQPLARPQGAATAAAAA